MSCMCEPPNESHNNLTYLCHRETRRLYNGVRWPHSMGLHYGYADLHSGWYITFNNMLCSVERCGHELRFFNTAEEAIEWGLNHVK